MTRSVSGLGAALTLSRLTLRRLLRGRVLWVSLSLAILPLAIVGDVPYKDAAPIAWTRTFEILIVLMAIIPALHLASAVGEEIEDNTVTYLWSRPFPRWSLLAGKLLALIPVAVLLVCGSIAGSFTFAFGDQVDQLPGALESSLLAASLGTITASCLCVGFGAIMPKHATSVSLVYLLVLDSTINEMPFAIQNITIRYHVEQIATSVDRDWTTPILWLAGMSIVWLAVAWWRVTVAEYSTDR